MMPFTKMLPWLRSFAPERERVPLLAGTRISGSSHRVGSDPRGPFGSNAGRSKETLKASLVAL